MYQIRDANQMVEEFMLAANVSVAEKILKHFPMCSLLRYTYTIDFECPTLLTHPTMIGYGFDDVRGGVLQL